MGDEPAGGADGSPLPVVEPATVAAVVVDEETRVALLRKITEEGGFAYVSSAELAAGGDLRAAEAAKEMAWEQLHSGPWHEVVSAWRDAYAMACLHVAELRASAGDRREALRALDMGLIMGGPLLRRDLDSAVGRIMARRGEGKGEGSDDGDAADRWKEEFSKNWDMTEVRERILLFSINFFSFINFFKKIYWEEFGCARMYSKLIELRWAVA